MSRSTIETRLRALPEPDLADPDNPELTAADFARMRPAEGVLPPDILAQFPRRRGRPRLEVRKTHVSLRLSPEVLAFYRSKGKGWQAAVEQVLRDGMSEAEAPFHRDSEDTNRS